MRTIWHAISGNSTAVKPPYFKLYHYPRQPTSKPPASDSEPPQSFPSVPPQDLHPTSDIRFVMVELGKFGTKIDRLIEDVGKHSEKIGALEKSVDRVRTGAIVAGSILSVVAIVFWWALGDRITSAVRTGILPTPTLNSESPPT